MADDGHPPASGRPLRDARSYRVGDRVGIFRIRHLSDTEVVMGQDDKHLDVQVSICKQPAAPGTAPRVVLSTVVHIHNTLGHAYMAVITPSRINPIGLPASGWTPLAIHLEMPVNVTMPISSDT